MSPNHSLAKANLGMVLTYSGEAEAAIPVLKDAMRQSPIYPDWFLSELARAYVQTGRYHEAVQVLERYLERDPDSGEALILLAAAQASAGRIRLQDLSASDAVGVLLDDTQDGLALPAPTGPRGGGSLGRCALPRSAGHGTLCLLVGRNGGELAFDLLELSVDIGLLLERLVSGLLNGDLALLDARPVRYGGGRSSIEICDLLVADRNFIHVKAFRPFGFSRTRGQFRNSWTPCRMPSCSLPR